MLNVVVVSDFAHIEGGNSAVALSSAIGLANVGHQITLFSAVLPVEPAILKSRIQVVCTDQHDIGKDPLMVRALVQGIWNRKAARLMRNTLQGLDRRNTVVHIHSWSKALSSSVISVALSENFKVICTLHDYFSVCPNGTFFNYRTDTICDLRPLSAACVMSQCDRRNYSHKLWRLTRQFVQNLFGGIPKDIRHFISVSEYSGNILKPYFAPGSQVHHVQNPVQVASGVPVNVELNSAYMAVGRITQEKGSQLFARAAKELGCEAIFVGDGDRRSEVLRICSSAQVTGWLPRNEVLNRLQKARVVVFPSLWYETDGLTVVEAAALGIPVIVSDGSAARNSVIDGVTGLWFKAGDSSDLKLKMSAMRDSEVVARMGRAAYTQYWKKPRTLERHVTELEEVYQKVLTC